MTEAETIEVTRFDAARALQTLAMRGRINLPAGKVAGAFQLALSPWEEQLARVMEELNMPPGRAPGV